MVILFITKALNIAGVEYLHLFLLTIIRVCCQHLYFYCLFQQKVKVSVYGFGMYQAFWLLLCLPFSFLFFVVLMLFTFFFFFFFSFVGVFVSADLDYFLASMIGLSGTQDMMVSINSILFCICLDQFYFLSKQVPAINVSLSSLLMELTTSVLIVRYIVLVSPYMAMRRK